MPSIKLTTYGDPQLTVTISTDLGTHSKLTEHPMMWDYLVMQMRDALNLVAKDLARAQGKGPKAIERLDAEQRGYGHGV